MFSLRNMNGTVTKPEYGQHPPNSTAAQQTSDFNAAEERNAKMRDRIRNWCRKDGFIKKEPCERRHIKKS